MKKLIPILLLLVGSAFGQNLPEAPRHRFFDKTNIALFTTSAVALAADGYGSNQAEAYSNQLIWNHAHNHALFFIGGNSESNPLARPFVNTRTGTALYFGGAFAAEMGVTYLLHRHGHHLMERIIPLVVTGTETYYGIRIHNAVRTFQKFARN